jgi:hypothetical protein
VPGSRDPAGTAAAAEVLRAEVTEVEGEAGFCQPNNWYRKAEETSSCTAAAAARQDDDKRCSQMVTLTTKATHIMHSCRTAAAAPWSLLAQRLATLGSQGSTSIV